MSLEITKHSMVFLMTLLGRLQHRVNNRAGISNADVNRSIRVYAARVNGMQVLLFNLIILI